MALPIVLYYHFVCEAWAITKTDARIMVLFERKV